MKVLFLVPYPTQGPSYRYRVEQYLPFLERAGVRCTVSSFLSSAFYGIIYKKGFYLRKALYFAAAVIRRLFDLLRVFRYDAVFIHLEAFPLGPPLAEWLIAVSGKKIIYDLDDALFLPRGKAARLSNYLKCTWKIPHIIRMSSRVITCNEYLRDYCLKYNKNVFVIPTSVDTAKFCPAQTPVTNTEPVIGWVGSHSTAVYLEVITNALQELARSHSFTFRIIGAGKDIAMPGVRIENVSWTLKREVEDFQDLDIGVYPLAEDEWIKGKTGFKTVQYMAVGVPCVVSALGRNLDIVKDGANGFLASTGEEWVQRLSVLLENPSLRKTIGLAGRKTVEERYSVTVNAPKLLEALR